MYSSKENIGILTSLLVEYGIREAVVCPGSRNAPIIHNLDECPFIKCYPVTDERSAAFVALGMAQANDRPVVVCVTSGTALLNTAPAVAEATYQHHGIIVISADRPAAWIGQGAGQTMPQPGALGSFVGKCVNIPEPHTEEDRWHINRLVNEALTETHKRHRPSVHINVPLSEPLFVYEKKELLPERMIEYFQLEYCEIEPCFDDFMEAKRPMIVIGQMDEVTSEFALPPLTALSERAVIVHEALSGYSEAGGLDIILKAIEDDKVEDKYLPDFALVLGGDIVSKRLKKMLSKVPTLWRVSRDGAICDTFQNLSGVLEGHENKVLYLLLRLYNYEKPSAPKGLAKFIKLWNDAIKSAKIHTEGHEPAYSQTAAVLAFEEQYYDSDFAPHIHYANSSAIRLANMFAHHFVWCNRGINGIEGSVSTAVGYAMAVPMDEPVVLVTGDLSFFYDSNALWNDNVPDNFSVLLLNNGEGGIFRQVEGFGDNPMAQGEHDANARGICLQNGVKYIAVHNAEELRKNIRYLGHCNGPLVVEVFTNAETDKKEFDKIFNDFIL
ncbi:MAG: 2-succinyl-5-enolpyruvyl-6-hydroxy-3-cyclohexene-1-carboxylic-acid synthase [Bacteroidales bacterium]|nr:2-succinyl-5-enolpyruvyl-6-hydroxy-3-cyclohexene-1-carboxylic-acid synthase [Bacteroidales bacterium]